MVLFFLRDDFSNLPAISIKYPRQFNDWLPEGWKQEHSLEKVFFRLAI
jgi:hypothetical protein